MSDADPLRSIAGLLATLADEAVEPLLVTFEALVESAAANRMEAAALLRATAAGSGDPARAARLRAAADAIEAGRPSALTAEGLTWREAAAAAGKRSPGEWRAQAAADEPRFAPDIETPPVILDAPPRLPRLRAEHFFPGLVVRLRRALADTSGREAPEGQRLVFSAMTSPDEANGFTLHFRERSFHGHADPGDDRSMIGNGGNGWFQPIPDRAALNALCNLVDARLRAAEEALDAEDDPDQWDSDMLLALRTDLDTCDAWLADDGTRPARRSKARRPPPSISARPARPPSGWRCCSPPCPIARPIDPPPAHAGRAS